MSAVAYHLEDLSRDATAMLRGLAQGAPPNVEAARELVKHAQTVLAAVEATKLAFPGGTVALGDLVEVDDKGAQRVMAAEHNARAERLEQRRAG